MKSRDFHLAFFWRELKASVLSAFLNAEENQCVRKKMMEQTSFGKRKNSCENDESLEFGRLPIRIKTEFPEVETCKEVSWLKMSDLHCMDSTVFTKNIAPSTLAVTVEKSQGYLWAKGCELVQKVG